MNYKFEPGNLILLESGNIGILLERFDMYERPDGEERNSYPCWCWRIFFNAPIDRREYSDKYGWAEVNISNGCYGKVIR